VATLADRIRSVSDVSVSEAEYLRTLCSSWQVLADLSFSDLFLYVKVADEELFEIAAQVRPFTSQTLYPQDLVGTKVSQPEQPIVERAWREGSIWAQDDPVLVDGLPIRMDAVPVRYGERVIAVLTKEGSPATSRRPGRLEQVYLQAAEHVSNMICAGRFPWPNQAAGEWPRVGDGLFYLDPAGNVEWASPNALSSLRRLGVRENIIGNSLDDLHLGETPVDRALAEGTLLDGELVLGDSHILLRVFPLLADGATFGALVLARDVSEVRQKERELSVKDATIREIHHRVKNNLQTIASLLRLQGRRLQSEEAKEALQESVLRIGSIALVHETLSEDPSHDVDFADVVRRISAMVREGLVLPENEIRIEVNGSTGLLGADLATPLAVTVTELMQNAIEHAFPDGGGGDLRVDLGSENGEVTVIVSDDGIGLKADPLSGSRLGLQIVRSLIDELGGRFELESDGGTRATVRVPRARKSRK
jgi:two-component sensor histidine kinase